MGRKGTTAALLALVGALAAAPAQAGEARSLNLAVYQKTSPDFVFEPIVLGDFAEFTRRMSKARMLLIAHTPAAVGGDVIVTQTNVLRDEGGALGDYGVECQLTLYDESEGDNPDYRVAGICRVLHDKEKMKVVAPKTSLPDTSAGGQAWVRIGEDPKSGIAFYANVGGH